MTVSLWEVLERSKIGPKMTQDEFNMEIFKCCQKLLKKYPIKYNKEEPIPLDDELLKNVFLAGIDLFVEVGIFNSSTSRVIKFTEEEVYEGFKELPTELVLGEGKDASVLHALKIGGGKEPIVCSGLQTLLYSSDEVMFKVYKACAEHLDSDGIWGGVVPLIDGKYEVESGTAKEIWAYRKSTEILRSAINAAGRPGMFIRNNAPTINASTALWDREKAMRPTDNFTANALSELIVNNDVLNRSVWAHLNNAPLDAGNFALVGGFGGSIEGSALVSLASALQGMMVMKADMIGAKSVPMREKSRVTREAIWIGSAATQALAQNTDAILSLGLGDHPASGPGTKGYFYEAAAGFIASTVSGSHSMGGTRKFVTGHTLDFGTPVESWFMGQISKAAAYIDREKANAIVKKLLAIYEPLISDPPLGNTLQELYDMENFVPNKTYQILYEEVLEELYQDGLTRLK